MNILGAFEGASSSRVDGDSINSKYTFFLVGCVSAAGRCCLLVPFFCLDLSHQTVGGGKMERKSAFGCAHIENEKKAVRACARTRGVEFGVEPPPPLLSHSLEKRSEREKR